MDIYASLLPTKVPTLLPAIYVQFICSLVSLVYATHYNVEPEWLQVFQAFHLLPSAVQYCRLVGLCHGLAVMVKVQVFSVFSVFEERYNAWGIRTRTEMC